METPNQDSGRTPAEQSSANELSVADRQINVLRDKLRHIDRQLAAATQNNSNRWSACWKRRKLRSCG